MKEGLKPGRRHKVHLSVDRTVAYHVGQRHGDAVVLNVNTEQMNRDGYLFVKSENNVWLTDFVPTIYLEIDTSYNINL
ncbi:RNA 2'-phosphotransferase [Asaia sp. HN010]|uniref:RNA 2'-phosphotransferase n=1 Tax=Asaia sp. HN010 TaxID=3081233 RepID=UPI0030197A8E